MPALSEYSSVHNTVFNIITNKGYQVWHDKEMEVYCAEKDGWDFMADSPCALMGLIAIYEYKKPDHFYEYWWKEDNVNLAKNLPEEAREYISVIKKK